MDFPNSVIKMSMHILIVIPLFFVVIFSNDVFLLLTCLWKQGLRRAVMRSTSAVRTSEVSSTSPSGSRLYFFSYNKNLDNISFQKLNKKTLKRIVLACFFIHFVVCVRIWIGCPRTRTVSKISALTRWNRYGYA